MKTIGRDFGDVARKVYATASGVLPNGKPVVINADGTVSVVTGADQALGSAVVFEAANALQIKATFDSSNNKIVIAYSDVENSRYGTAIVGTISGTSISFGTAVVFEAATVYNVSATFDSNANKVVISYRDAGNSNYGTAIVGTVSGTNISFGTPVIFFNGSCQQISSTFDSNVNKVVITFQSVVSSPYPVSAIVGTVSGTGISFGTAAVFNNANTSGQVVTFDSSANKVVIAYKDVGNSSYGTAIVGTISGTDISFGTEVVFNSANGDQLGLDYDATAQKVVIAYRNFGNSSYGTAIVGTVSGTGISFGTAAVYNTAAVGTYSSVVYNAAVQKTVIFYLDGGNSSYGTFVVATISGTSISFGTKAVFENAAANFLSAVYDSNAQKIAIAYQDAGNSNYGTAIVLQPGNANITAENYIGMSSGGQVASGSSATVDIIGTVNSDQSSLTAGQSYFVQTDGTLGLTADDPSVFAGTAISATKLLVKS